MNPKTWTKLMGVGKFVVAGLLFLGTTKPIQKIIAGVSVLAQGAGEFQRPIANIVPYLLGYGIGFVAIVAIGVMLLRSGLKDVRGIKG